MYSTRRHEATERTEILVLMACAPGEFSGDCGGGSVTRPHPYSAYQSSGPIVMEGGFRRSCRGHPNPQKQEQEANGGHPHVNRARGRGSPCPARSAEATGREPPCVRGFAALRWGLAPSRTNRPRAKGKGTPPRLSVCENQVSVTRAHPDGTGRLGQGGTSAAIRGGDSRDISRETP